MDGSRGLGRELGGGPMSVAVPYAPCDRGVRLRQLLENLHRFHWGEIQPAINLGEMDAEKTGMGQVLRNIFRYPASRLDMVSLREDTGPKCSGGFQKRGTGSAVGHGPLLSRFSQMGLASFPSDSSRIKLGG